MLKRNISQEDRHNRDVQKFDESFNIQGGAQNVIPLIVHVTHFYYYKNFDI